MMTVQIIDRSGTPLAASSDYSSPASGYEGAQDNGTRDSFLAFPTNSRREINSYTRKELQRKVRALAANLPLFERIHSKVGQHSVGKGIFVRPLTRDKEWNDLNRKRYENRVSNPLVYSVDGSCDLYEDQRYFAETLPGDGEVFEAFVRSETGAPMVQRLDPFEIETPRDLTRLGKDARWQDGVLTNHYSRPIAYNVRELSMGDFWFNRDTVDREVAVDAMVHVFKRRRAHQTRGLPWAFNGVNDGIDALDLKALIKGKAKLHSALAIAVRKKAAEAGRSGISDQVKKLLDSDGKVTQVDEKFWKGAAITYLAADEGIDLLSSDCPGDNLTAFIEMLYREIAIGYGLPLEIVYNMASLGGPGTRAVLEDGQWLFDCVQDTIVMRHSQRHYVWDTALAVKDGKIRPCKDPEWWFAAWRGPAKLTVDLGRTADAAIKLIKNGALSHVRYFEERAQDAYEEAEEQIQFLAWLKGRCAEAGVDFTLLIEPTPGAVTNISVATKDE
jgi:capsid protein